MRKILIIILLLIVILLGVTIFKKTHLPKESTPPSSDSKNINNGKGEYVLKEGAYELGKDIPFGKYTVVDFGENTDVSVVNTGKDGDRNIENLKKGDELTFSKDNKDYYLVVTNDTLTLK